MGFRISCSLSDSRAGSRIQQPRRLLWKTSASSKQCWTMSARAAQPISPAASVRRPTMQALTSAVSSSGASLGSGGPISSPSSYQDSATTSWKSAAPSLTASAEVRPRYWDGPILSLDKFRRSAVTTSVRLQHFGEKRYGFTALLRKMTACLQHFGEICPGCRFLSVMRGEKARQPYERVKSPSLVPSAKTGRWSPC